MLEGIDTCSYWSARDHGFDMSGGQTPQKQTHVLVITIIIVNTVDEDAQLEEA
jgi:hypothetical protein